MGNNARTQPGTSPPTSTATFSRREVAKLGEDAAAQYLANVGYVILERNVRSRFGEIDIVARDGAVLVFVEVRARSGKAFGSPEESVTAAKAEKMTACALAYLGEHRAAAASWRIDFIGVDVADGHVTRLRHLKHVIQ